MYVTYTRIYGWSDYGGESSYQPGYRLENMMWMTLLVYDYIIPGDKENIIAIIGDGSLSGGEALEGLNVAGSEINSNLIIIVNDNEQSIAEVHGGMYKNLAELRETGGTASNNLFKAFGLDYIYEENGNDIASLISLFRKVKDTDHPIVVHIHTGI